MRVPALNTLIGVAKVLIDDTEESVYTPPPPVPPSTLAPILASPPRSFSLTSPPRGALPLGNKPLAPFKRFCTLGGVWTALALRASEASAVEEVVRTTADDVDADVDTECISFCFACFRCLAPVARGFVLEVVGFSCVLEFLTPCD